MEKESEEIKEVPSVEVKKEDNTKEEDKKIKEIVAETSKTSKDSRKEIQRSRTVRDEKTEKKEEKVVPTTSKSIELVPAKLKEEKNKIDDREERIKMRELLKMDVAITTKEEAKQDLQNVKNIKLDDIQKNLKTTRREVKKEDKEDEVKLKKPILALASTTTSNSEIEAKNNPETSNETTSKKSRSIFSRFTGNKKPKTSSGKIPRANSKQIGINAARHQRSFSEHMKAMVKKVKSKIKNSIKPEVKTSNPLTQPPLLSLPVDISDDDKKKKSILSSEEERKKKASLQLDEEKKKKITSVDKDEEKKKKVVSTLDKDEEKKKKLASEEQEKVHITVLQYNNFIILSKIRHYYVHFMSTVVLLTYHFITCHLFFN